MHGQPADDAIHIDLANDIIKALYSEDMESTFCRIFYFHSLLTTSGWSRRRKESLVPAAWEAISSRQCRRRQATNFEITYAQSSFGKPFDNNSLCAGINTVY